MRLRFTFLAIFFLSITSLYVSAQERKHSDLPHEKRHKLANNLIGKGSYYSAIEHLEDLAKKNPNNDKYLMRLADAYYLSRDYKNAEIWYDKVVKIQKKVSPALFQYAQCLKYNGKYTEAGEAFKNFALSKYKENKGEKYKRLAKNEVLSCEWAIQHSDTNEFTTVSHLGDHVNSRYSEFAPVLRNDSTLIFSSLQSDSVISVDPEEPHTFHVKLLSSNKENNEWGPHTELENINTVYESNANGTFSADRKRFYFTRCIPNENHEMICSIYMSEAGDTTFQKAVKLNKDINKKGFTATQPCIGLVTSGKQQYEVLFFTSNRKGGKGGVDIWYSIINKDGTYKLPVNAGNVINTLGDEITPYFHNQSGILYFSSNFHYGYGGYDIFAAKGSSLNQWGKPVNIGKPVNSRVDDTYYSLNKNKREGFIVSNRPEGYHLTSETCCDDIYSFRIRNLFALMVEAFSAKDTSKPVEVKFLIRVKYSDTLSLPSVHTDSGNYKIDSLSAAQIDSVNYRNKFLEVNNFIASIKDTLRVNPLIDKKTYPEVDASLNNFDLKLSHDYIVYAVGKFDTSMFVFRTSGVEHKVIGSYTADTLTNYTIKEGQNIDLMKIRFYLDADSVKPVIALQKIEEVIEDERTNTVTKFIEDVKEKKIDNLKIILNYDFDDARFIEVHAPSLDSLADLMKEFPELKINIAAHTDDKGSPHYNMELSKRRSRSIEIYLSRKGIDKKRMISSWFGETQPVVPNSNPDGSDNPENRHFNRRAEITIIRE